MNNHRSIAEALKDPKTMEFVHGKKLSNQPPAVVLERLDVTPAQDEKATAAETNDMVKLTKPKPPHRKRTRPRKPKEQSRQDPEHQSKLTNAFVHFTTRLTQDTAEALRRASLERKLAGLVTCSQQDIAEVAIATWLKAQGHLKDAA